MFALVDCNNFYASCERIFRPDLEKRPVMVLSNNDGIVIARSQEVKNLGIPMGAAVFKYRQAIKCHKIEIFSSNFSLYGDISERVMKVLSQFSSELEVYSIDEAFLPLDGTPQTVDLHSYGKLIRQTVKKWVGIPVSVGLAPTKTLAKAANELAKKHPEYEGVLNLCDKNEKQIQNLLRTLEIGDVWGIGRRYSQFLKKLGVKSAFDFINLEDKWLKKHLGVGGLRTAMELRGISCLKTRENIQPRKSMLCSRSFERTVRDLETVRQALSRHVCRAAEKLREQNSMVNTLYVFLYTNRFSKQEQYYNGQSFTLSSPTADTGTLIKAAQALLDKIYRPQFSYKKVGVVFSNLVSAENYQLQFFAKNHYDEKKRRLMKAVDQINGVWGGDTVLYASQGVGTKEDKDKNFRSPHYTTSWKDLLEVG